MPRPSSLTRVSCCEEQEACTYVLVVADSTMLARRDEGCVMVEGVPIGGRDGHCVSY